MDITTVTEQDYFGAISALREYRDLSCVTNGPAFLIKVCRAYIMISGDKKEEAYLNQLLTERGFVFTCATTTAPSDMWTNPRDGISTPLTFS